MTVIIGPNSILERALPTGIDSGEILKWQLRDGMTFEQFLQQNAMALAAGNTHMSRWVS